MTADSTPAAEKSGGNFIRNIIIDDLAKGKNGKRVFTRFPPEPNGYLHLGHAKSICLNFGIAEDHLNGSFGIQPSGEEEARCHLRFDDTNPSNESEEFLRSIQEDIQWLGFAWGDHLYFASNYFERLYEAAETLIKKELAYVCELSSEEIREYRGTLKEPGKPSPFRDRSVDENLTAFAKMRAGDYEDGKAVLRAKIDMSAGNINLRDPILYRVKRAHHMRLVDGWLYPTYDFAHGLSDAFEQITHSLCTLEFVDHRPLYDWINANVGVQPAPQQIEFAPLAINYSIMSKRYIRRLVEEGIVSGWDDPRLLTFKGMRRRGYPPRAIRTFCQRIGVSRKESVIDLSLLEDCVREDLNETAARRMGVVDPIKVVIETYDEGKSEELTVVNHPKDESMGNRKVSFSRELFIERSDFMEDAPKKFFRLTVGKEVRLRYGYIIKCESVIKDDAGQVTELRCSHDPDTLGKNPADGRKVKGIIHWVDATQSLPAKIKLYDRLYKVPSPDPDAPYEEVLNPDSLQTNAEARVEKSLGESKSGEAFQFERLGYFAVDPDSSPQDLVFNRVVTLRDSWAKS